MLDLARRILVVLIMGLCIGLLFVSGKMAKAEEEQSWYWPVEGVMTDVFGSRNEKHYGIDIAASVGTPVYAVSSGRVTRSYYSDTYGHVVFLEQENGYETVYAHLHKRLVAEGERVQASQQIGEVGNTGRSSGAHLHFEVHKGKWNIEKSNAINPLIVLDHTKLHAYLTEAVTEAVFKQVHQKQMSYVVTVRKGDTLWSISKKHNVTVEELQQWNDVQPNQLYIGQALKVNNDS
ncbi:peptidoglycan DD-metalloendopeptidase family protein [Metabacillus iocasae]|uniref:Murein DD-endopeptidase MepM/ murein hydrolase activator NlpD n=1 Tax=Priestia iocasae TaxID=2291674 RepID=A0ABS2QQE7_9BACI|nr:peptidoglycan DD-metalloendopeptidase family protein [Metabacillus iocasae]MBM7701685.1 murein DD-endopeptidase MepM/ murein hydrolase activator NlpD [Metabacillus iocasae]